MTQDPKETPPSGTAPAPPSSPNDGEPPKAEAPKAEPSKVEPSKAEPSKAEPSKAEPSKAEPSKAEAPKAEPSKAEAPKVEAPKAEAPKVEPSKAEAPKVEAPKVEAPKAEPPKAEEPAKSGKTTSKSKIPAVTTPVSAKAPTPALPLPALSGSPPSDRAPRPSAPRPEGSGDRPVASTSAWKRLPGAQAKVAERPDDSKARSGRIAVQLVDAQQPEHDEGHKKLLVLMLGALGVVYGDIGTSVLYAVKQCFRATPDIGATPDHILGVLSLIFWALTITISVQYCGLVLRADNRGEGGILALMALLTGGQSSESRIKRLAILGGLFGAALLYGDSAITPAISVLSAVEGLELVTDRLHPYIVPITIAILVALFAVQSRGTARVGAVFGPICVTWFLVLFALGLNQIVREPGVLWALNPVYGARFLADAGWHGILVLGGVFLVVTGGEALYADMGHFGRRPIRLAWFTLVLPSLLCNYFGQGALLLQNPKALDTSPFFLLAPSWALGPLVLLATAATVIASQAVISGAFSMTQQAVHLGFLPRTEVRHTSSEEIGQIYVPSANWMLLALTISLVIGFRRADNLAGAYGIAVTLTMVVTTSLLYMVAREKWGWSRWSAVPVFGTFLLVDLSYFSGNVLKIAEGGWFPLGIGVLVSVLFTTWRKGRAILWKRLQERSVPIERFLQDLPRMDVIRRFGTGVFMTGDPKGVPPILPHHMFHTGVLPERVVLLTVKTLDVPFVRRSEWVKLEKLESGFVRVLASVGYMEDPTVARIFRQCRAQGLDIDPHAVTYYLGREVLLATDRPGMAIWRERLFEIMSRNSQRPTDYFEIPPERVLEIGIQVEM